MKLTKEELFIESLYKFAEEQLKKVYKLKKVNRDKILQEIANILLTYTIANDVMVMDKVSRDKEYKKLSELIIDISRGDAVSQEKIIEEILSKVVKETFSYYHYNKGLKDVKKIVDANFKGKHFSERVWSNEKEIANNLHRKVNDFLKGKVNVNQIRKDIEKTFNTSAYNSKRLVTTEVARCSSNAFDRYCKEVGVKKVKYNATLDGKLCDDCGQYHDKVFDLNKKIELPRHPLCRCFYIIEDKNINGLDNEIKIEGKEYDLNYPISESNVEWHEYINIDKIISDKLNDVHTDLNRYMIENKKEKLSLLRISDNDIIAEQIGDIDSISLSRETVKLLKQSSENDIIFVHSHPSRTTFSKSDIDKIIKYKSIKTMTLECSDGSKYILDRGQLKSSIFDRMGFDDKYYNIYWEVAKKYPQLNDELMIYEIWDDFLDEVNKELAKHYGMFYMKVE